MTPKGALMIEHRLIEKVLITIKNKVEKSGIRAFDPVLIDTIVDFIKVYADRTHHGKEEDILFAELTKRNIDEKNKIIMNELTEEHKQARMKVKQIIDLNDGYKKGNKNNINNIMEILLWLTAFYPIHIKKEDKLFFPETEKYFNKDELDKMLNDFWEFDRKMIHEKYKNVYEQLTL